MKTLSTQSEESSVSSQKKKFTFQDFIDTLKNLRELIVIIGALLAGVAWIVSYFATRDQLEKLECYTKVNVRMLQATAGVNYANQQIKQAHVDTREQSRILESIRLNSKGKVETDAMVKSAENRLDELAQTEKTLATNKDAEQKTSQRALAALTENACLDLAKRNIILDQLARGEF
jgi:ABC-type Na+ efflux pump permease subunit